MCACWIMKRKININTTNIRKELRKRWSTDGLHDIKVLSLEMKTTVLLMIILVKQDLNGYTVKLSSCRHNGTFEFSSADNITYELKLCLSNSTCFESHNITFHNQSHIAIPQNVTDYLEGFDCNCNQCATTTPYSSDGGSSFTATSIATTTEVLNHTSSNINSSTRQNILIALLALFAVLLAIVTTGWVCTCWAMKKRIQEMNVNTTNNRYSKMQVIGGKNTTSLRHNLAYCTQPEKETNNSNTDGEYEIIPPLMNEKTNLRLKNTKDSDNGESSNVQTNQSTTQSHQQASPRQPKEEVQHTHVQLEQAITESEMQTKYRNEYHNETGNTQQENSEDQVEQDSNTERVYDVIDTLAVVHNTTTTNIQEVSTEQHTYTATEQQQMSQNDPHGHEDMESHSDRQNQTRLDDGNEEDQTSTHIYHILEQQSEEHVELKDHNPAAEYEVPATNRAVHHQ